MFLRLHLYITSKSVRIKEVGESENMRGNTAILSPKFQKVRPLITISVTLNYRMDGYYLSNSALYIFADTQCAIFRKAVEKEEIH